MTNVESASIKPAGFDVLSAVTCADEIRPIGNAFRGLSIFGKYCAQLPGASGIGITMPFTGFPRIAFQEISLKTAREFGFSMKI